MEKTDIVIEKLNEAFCRIHCDDSIAAELSDHFMFDQPGAMYSKAHRRNGGWWDGKIRLFNKRGHTIYTGLKNKIIDFAKIREYSVEEIGFISDNEFSLKEAIDYADCDTFKYAARDYQAAAFCRGIRSRRAFFLCPTASGKSFIIFLLTHFLRPSGKVLIIVPTLGLIHQMFEDLSEYDLTGETRKEIQVIFQGKTKEISKRIVISTWQSIDKMTKEWYNQFEMIIGDEAHTFKASSLKRIMENSTDVAYRIGMTGSLDGATVHELVLEGLFGPIRKVTTAAKLIKDGTLSKLEIKIIELDYPQEDRIEVAQYEWLDEKAWLQQDTRRNNFIGNLVHSLDGNVMVMFENIAHGDALEQVIKAKNNKAQRPLYYMHGQNSEGEERNKVAKIVNQQKDAIMIVSSRIFSTGVNIPNLKYVIFTSPTKSQITVMQSIGRSLRKTETTYEAVLYDIVDNLKSYGRKNTALRHGLERQKIYRSEKFPYKIYNVKLGGIVKKNEVNNIDNDDKKKKRQQQSLGDD